MGGLIMPDITMCTDNECPVKETCYRFKAKPLEYQTYFLSSPRLDERESESKGIVEGSCSYYWKIVETDTWSEVDEMTI